MCAAPEESSTKVCGVGRLVRQRGVSTAAGVTGREINTLEGKLWELTAGIQRRGTRQKKKYFKH